MRGKAEDVCVDNEPRAKASNSIRSLNLLALHHAPSPVIARSVSDAAIQSF